MSLYSGSVNVDPNQSHLLDLIAGEATDNEIRKALDSITEPEIGALMYTANLNQPVQVDKLSYKSQLPNGFNGWLYANGSEISKTLFPDVFNKFNSMEYPGKKIDGDFISIPNITKFFKLISNSSSTPYVENQSAYAMPSHKHTFKDIAGAEVESVVRRCAFVWSTYDFDESDKGGKMPEITLFQKFGEIGWANIPPSPSLHCGRSSTVAGTHLIEWDIPIDTSYGSVTSHLNCNSGKTGEIQADCWPTHMCVPIMVYVGKVK